MQPQASDPSTPVLEPLETEAPRTDVVPSTDDGDHDRYAHIVAKADASRAYVTGEPITARLTRSPEGNEPITALCGKKWTPSRDPDRYPVCPSCKEMLAKLRDEAS